MANNRNIPEVKKITPDQQTELDTALAHNRAHQLVQAPHDVLQSLIGKRPELEVKDISHLTKTCARFHSLFQPVVDQAGIQKLLKHIAYGEQIEAEKMINASPYLLMMSGDVVDYSLRKIINVTPAQLAFGGDDEVMCAMLKEKLGAEEFEKQISEKFIEDAEAEKQSLDEFTEIINQLVDAISDPQANILDEINHVANDSPLRNLLDTFRVKFAPGEVRAGKHFNVQFLLKACEIYDANYERWGLGWGQECQLFWSQVVGYLERLLPVSYVQAACDGLGDVVLGKPLRRQFKLLDNTTYFPLDANPAKRLGFDHGIYIGPGSSCLSLGKWACGVGRGDFKTCVEQKLQACRMMRPHREETTSWCIVC
jgi:hypothetical protein